MNDITKEMYHDVASQMSTKRFEHVLRVEKMAMLLAKQYQVEELPCRLAALYHDYAKEWDFDRYASVVEGYHLNPDLLAYGSELLHGPVAAVYLKDLGKIDEVVSEAIYYHSIGAPIMSDVAKILFVADYIEEGRQFHGVELARQLAFEDLNKAITYKLQHTISFLAEKKVKIYPETILAYNQWITKEY